MFQLRKKTIAVTTAAFVIAGGGAAFAYWTTTGTGTSGDVQNAQANGTLVLSADFAAGIAPGGSKTVTFKATNAGTTDLKSDGDIHATVQTDVLGCLPAWFHITDITPNVTVPANTTTPMTIGTSTLSFDNLPTTPQDDCKGANVTLTLSTVPTPPPAA